MASHPIPVIFLLIATVLPAITLGKEFIVGDQFGWTIGFDYKTWTAGKEFHVGDKLVFRYPVGVHNVFRVNGTDFKNCTVPPGSKSLTTGNDTIMLATPGRKWYLCDVGKHCENGQKLFITVEPAVEVAPAPSMALSPAQALPAYYSSKGAKDTIYQLSSITIVAIVTLIMI
ncbi:hypothetical protein CRYUN_Cryun20dG0098700 [Craigia yunnanensis]